MQSTTYQQQQAEIEKQQQLFHIMQNSNFMANQHQSPTHFFASLLQNPAVLGNPELMASVASMLQSSLQQQNQVQNVQPQVQQVQSKFPQSGNCFRNFSIPSSHSSNNKDSTTQSSVCSSETRSNRSPSQSSNNTDNTNSDKNLESEVSSDNESHNDHNIDISEFINSNDLVVNKVKNVIEEILCNENISKNNFLGKLFEDNLYLKTKPQILVKRVAGFKRVKAITTDFKIVQSALNNSKMFTMSEDGLSAYKTTLLPIIPDHSERPSLFKNRNNGLLGNSPSDRKIEISSSQKSEKTTSTDSSNKVVKKVLAINFSPEDFNIENMTKIFEKIGEIAQIILVRPNKEIPSFLADYIQWVPDLGSKPCAIIDFETQEAAQNACREINMSNKEGENIRCALLKPGARIKRTLYRKYTSGNKSTENNINSKISSNSSTTSFESSSTRSTNSRMSQDSNDSGLSNNSTQLNKNFNRKTVKKAISKHFINLGAWKNSTTSNNSENTNQLLFSEVSTCQFIRQPRGPCKIGNGFGMSRTVVC